LGSFRKLEHGDGSENVDQLPFLDEQTDNSNITYQIVPDRDHFSVVAPVLTAISAAILADDGKVVEIQVQLAKPEVVGKR
jgi:hypothetical protein